MSACPRMSSPIMPFQEPLRSSSPYLPSLTRCSSNVMLISAAISFSMSMQKPATHNTIPPITTQPITTQPITTQPIKTQPITTQPTTTQPITTQPITRQPIKTQPTTTQPITTQPITGSNALTNPVKAFSGSFLFPHLTNKFLKVNFLENFRLAQLKVKRFHNRKLTPIGIVFCLNKTFFTHFNYNFDRIHVFFCDSKQEADFFNKNGTEKSPFQSKNMLIGHV